MTESANTFPMDITDPSSRPWTFKPEGYLVVVLAGTEEAQRAESALVAAGSLLEMPSSTPANRSCKTTRSTYAPGPRHTVRARSTRSSTRTTR